MHERNWFKFKRNSLGFKSALRPSGIASRTRSFVSSVTLGGDKGFDTAEFVAECRYMNVTPHGAQNTADQVAVQSTRVLRDTADQVAVQSTRVLRGTVPR
jgi:hypothetical protein